MFGPKWLRVSSTPRKWPELFLTVRTVSCLRDAGYFLQRATGKVIGREEAEDRAFLFRAMFRDQLEAQNNMGLATPPLDYSRLPAA